jgi:hypothetical protein
LGRDASDAVEEAVAGLGKGAQLTDVLDIIHIELNEEGEVR